MTPLSDKTRQWWIISIAGYGKYCVYATKQEAETSRANKAEWEGGVGKKRLADPNNPADVLKVKLENDSRRIFKSLYYPAYEETYPDLEAQ